MIRNLLAFKDRLIPSTNAIPAITFIKLGSNFLGILYLINNPEIIIPKESIMVPTIAINKIN